MGISILTEPVSGGKYRASTGSPLSIEVEASTREAAKEQLVNLIRERVCSGTVVQEIEIGLGPNHPLAPFAGDLKDHPLLEEWQQAIRDFRASLDPDADR